MILSQFVSGNFWHPHFIKDCQEEKKDFCYSAKNLDFFSRLKKWINVKNNEMAANSVSGTVSLLNEIVNRMELKILLMQTP